MAKKDNHAKTREAASVVLMGSTEYEWFPVISSPGWLIRQRDKFPDWEDEARQLIRTAWDGFRAEIQAGQYGHLLAKRDELRRSVEQSLDDYVLLSDGLADARVKSNLAEMLKEKYDLNEPIGVIDKEELLEPWLSHIPPEDAYTRVPLVDDSYTRPPTIEEFCIDLVDADTQADLQGQMSRNWHRREVIAFRLSVLESILDYENLFGPAPSWDALLKQIKGVPLLGKAEISTQAHETTIAIGKYCRGERKSIQQLTGSTETDNYRCAGFGGFGLFFKKVASECDPNPKTGRPYSKEQIRTRLEQTNCFKSDRGGKTDLKRLGVMIDRCVEYFLVHGKQIGLKPTGNRPKTSAET